MVCKKLKYYNDLKDMLDKYDKYIDFQYTAVINIWFSLEVREKVGFIGYYKDFFNKLKEIKEKHYKARKSLYSSIQQSQKFSLSCINECKCKESNLNYLKSIIEKDLFLEVCSKFRVKYMMILIFCVISLCVLYVKIK